MITDSQLKDLGRLACQRCEQATNSVGQFLDNEEQACELLLNVINSMLLGCAKLMQSSSVKDDGEKPSEKECTVLLLAMLARANGIAEINCEENRSQGNVS